MSVLYDQSKDDAGRRKKTDESTPDDKKEVKSSEKKNKESEEVSGEKDEKKESEESFVAPAEEGEEVYCVRVYVCVCVCDVLCSINVCSSIRPFCHPHFCTNDNFGTCDVL